MKTAVIYLMSGPAHLPYLVVSLYTLRKYWDGNVKVFAWKESIDIVKQISHDPRLQIEVEESEPEYRARRDEGRQGKNDQFVAKVRLAQTLNYDRVLYLDADTSVHGDIDPLFQASKDYSFLATRFSNWTTKGNIVRNRIERLRECPSIPVQHIDTILQDEWPSVNGGVWVADPKSEVLKLWDKWTWEARHQFIADESVLHTLMPEFMWQKGMMNVWPDGRFNCSCNPSWVPKEIPHTKIRIWHYHGDNNVRPDKFGGAGYKQWVGLFGDCWLKNIGGIKDWMPSIESRWFDALEKSE